MSDTNFRKNVKNWIITTPILSIHFEVLLFECSHQKILFHELENSCNKNLSFLAFKILKIIIYHIIKYSYLKIFGSYQFWFTTMMYNLISNLMQIQLIFVEMRGSNGIKFLGESSSPKIRSAVLIIKREMILYML